MNSGFLDKLLERLGRVRPEEVRDYVVRLADEKGFFETIFDALHEGVIVTDPAGSITYLNRTACGFFGIERDAAMGHPLAEQLRGLDWNAIATSEKSVSRDMEVFYPQNRFLNFYVAPLRVEKSPAKKKGTSEQELIGYAVILRDITESRKSTEETIQSERLNALTMLAAGVAHEIGNPLNSLNIQLQLLARRLRKLPETQRKDLVKSVDVAKEEIARLDTIIRQFLGAIRPARLERRLENVNHLVEESVRFLNAETTDRNIIVETELRRNPRGRDEQNFRALLYDQGRRQWSRPAHRAPHRARARRRDRIAERLRKRPRTHDETSAQRPARADARGTKVVPGFSSPGCAVQNVTPEHIKRRRRYKSHGDGKHQRRSHRKWALLALRAQRNAISASR